MSPLNFDAQIFELTKEITKLENKGDLSKTEDRKLKNLKAARKSIDAKLRASLTGKGQVEDKKSPPLEDLSYNVGDYQKAFRKAAANCQDTKDPERVNANCVFDQLPQLITKQQEKKLPSPKGKGAPYSDAEYHNAFERDLLFCSSNQNPDSPLDEDCMNVAFPMILEKNRENSGNPKYRQVPPIEPPNI